MCVTPSGVGATPRARHSAAFTPSQLTGAGSWEHVAVLWRDERHDDGDVGEACQLSRLSEAVGGWLQLDSTALQ